MLYLFSVQWLSVSSICCGVLETVVIVMPEIIMEITEFTLDSVDFDKNWIYGLIHAKQAFY